MALRGAAVTNSNYFFGAQGRLEAAERSAAILDALHDVVEVLKMFPDKMPDAWVALDTLFSAVGEYIPLRRAAYRDVVYVGDGCVGDFWLENISDVVMKDRNGISPAHWKSDKPEGAEGGLEGC